MTLSIRKILKRSFDRINNERVKHNILQAIPFWIASLVAGLLAVAYSAAFSYFESQTFNIFEYHSWAIFIVSPVCFLIAWWLVVRFGPYARTSGIPQVRAAIELDTTTYNKKIKKLLSIKILFIKVISGLFMILGGGAVGKEGPIIQLSGIVFKKFNDWLPSWWPPISKRNMITAGAAAGLAAAFNTPLGGIVFAIEELTKTHFSYFKTALFTAVIIAGLTAQGILGPYLYLGFPDVTHVKSSIIFALLIVSIICGLLGSYMSEIILALFRWKKSFKFTYQHVLYIVGCALLMATIAFFLDPKILGSGRDIMLTTLFSGDKYVHWYTAIFRIVGPILSFGTGASAGIFAPSLAAGASVGSFMAGIFNESASNANLLILCGMVGFLTGVTRTPFTSAILVLEMTDRHSVIFYLLIAGMLAQLVSLFVNKHSLYDHLKVQTLHDLTHEEEKPELET
ncbi:MAG TPA: chloride channel protein [Hanamia sp.]|nr:chloride channel protein [Hanamia sp.]